MTFRGILDIHYNLTGHTSWLRDNSAYTFFSSKPIDGSVFTIGTDGGANFSERVFTANNYTIDDLSTALGDVQYRDNLGWGQTQYNFALINTEPSTLDWITQSDYIVNNFSLMGRFVTEGGLYGLAFDPEGYSARQWNYEHMTSRNQFSFEEYEEHIYSVAKQIAGNWLSYDRDFKFWSYVGYNVWFYGRRNYGEANDYGLYKAFLDGIYDKFGEIYNAEISGGALSLSPVGFSFRGRFRTSQPFSGPALDPPTSKIIIGTEDSYTCLTDTCLNTWLTNIEDGIDYLTEAYNAELKGESVYFDSMSEFAIGLWLSYFENGSPFFDPTLPETNYFTPSTFKTVLGQVMDKCEWAFIFTQKVEFYPGAVPVTAMPQEYIDAIQELRDERGL